jgi:hypothetical protein
MRLPVLAFLNAYGCSVRAAGAAQRLSQQIAADIGGVQQPTYCCASLNRSSNSVSDPNCSQCGYMKSEAGYDSPPPASEHERFRKR